MLNEINRIWNPYQMIVIEFLFKNFDKIPSTSL